MRLPRLVMAATAGFASVAVAAAQPAADPNRTPLDCTVVDATTVVFTNTTGETIPQGLAIHYSVDLADGPNIVQFLYVPVELAPGDSHEIRVRDPLASCRAWLRPSERAAFDELADD